jgi:hypothetical protein
LVPIVVIVHIVTVHIVRWTSVGIGIGDVAAPRILHDLLIDGSYGAVVEVEPSLRMQILNVVVVVVIVDDDDDGDVEQDNSGIQFRVRVVRIIHEQQ